MHGVVQVIWGLIHSAAYEFSSLLLIIVFLVILLVIFLRGRARMKNFETEVSDMRDEHNELADFLDRFIRGIGGNRGVEGALHTTARNIAEKINAESVAIYEKVGNRLICRGVHGPFWLVHDRNADVEKGGNEFFDILADEKIIIGQGYLGGVWVSKCKEIIPDASVDSRFADYPHRSKLESMMIVPLFQKNEITGVMVALNNTVQRWLTFSRDQLSRMERFANEAAMVVQLTKVYGDISNRQRISQELDFARKLQQASLPDKFPELPELSVVARTRSAKEVNGDFYDFIRLDDSRYLILLGDACGKGIPACLMAMMTRCFARSIADNFTNLTDFLNELNDKLYRDTEPDKFITLGCCLIDTRNWLMEFGRAGHTDLVTYVHRHLRRLSPCGVGLGILPREYAKFDTICISLDPGTKMIMFSDGLTEAINRQAQEFGVERLSQAFLAACDHGGDSEQVVDSILETVSDYESTQSDDQTLLLIGRSGESVR